MGWYETWQACKTTVRSYVTNALKSGLLKWTEQNVYVSFCLKIIKSRLNLPIGGHAKLDPECPWSCDLYTW